MQVLKLHIVERSKNERELPHHHWGEPACPDDPIMRETDCTLQNILEHHSPEDDIFRYLCPVSKHHNALIGIDRECCRYQDPFVCGQSVG
jgi:hypothetical protein